ncbi:hypothetical protein EJ08DRAFT_682264 [Tothia fuscella]|uniref:Uncharacterized protein n=1 Tax=Tothia fuscella TaxID=1048955 RepID=A0A9P4NJA6_9PEZI|nr:hypothetical protein EJ08DRAFT_682264 [Tothia fuscella]
MSFSQQWVHNQQLQNALQAAEYWLGEAANRRHERDQAVAHCQRLRQQRDQAVADARDLQQQRDYYQTQVNQLRFEVDQPRSGRQPLQSLHIIREALPQLPPSASMHNMSRNSQQFGTPTRTEQGYQAQQPTGPPTSMTGRPQTPRHNRQTSGAASVSRASGLPQQGTPHSGHGRSSSVATAASHPDLDPKARDIMSVFDNIQQWCSNFNPKHTAADRLSPEMRELVKQMGRDWTKIDALFNHGETRSLVMSALVIRWLEEKTPVELLLETWPSQEAYGGYIAVAKSLNKAGGLGKNELLSRKAFLVKALINHHDFEQWKTSHANALTGKLIKSFSSILFNPQDAGDALVPIISSFIQALFALETEEMKWSWSWPVFEDAFQLDTMVYVAEPGYNGKHMAKVWLGIRPVITRIAYHPSGGRETKTLCKAHVLLMHDLSSAIGPQVY